MCRTGASQALLLVEYLEPARSIKPSRQFNSSGIVAPATLRVISPRPVAEAMMKHACISHFITRMRIHGINSINAECMQHRAAGPSETPREKTCACLSWDRLLVFQGLRQFSPHRFCTLQIQPAQIRHMPSAKTIFHRYFGKQQSASYLFSFLILHEVTAIVPIPLFYALFCSTNWHPEIPQKWLDYGIRLASRSDNVSDSSHANARDVQVEQQMQVEQQPPPQPQQKSLATKTIYLASAYALTKMLMPARIALSVMLTPWLARRAVQPSMEWIRRQRPARKE